MGKITFNLIMGIIAIIVVIYSFFGMNTSASLLSFEVDIWVYRAFWAVVATGCFYDHFRKSNQTTK